MAFDQDKHVLDPKTGYQVDKDTGHKVGLEMVPDKHVGFADFPKWVVPHDSHVHRKGEGEEMHLSTPAFVDYAVDRVTKVVKVLVHDSEEQAKALAPWVAPK